MKQLKLSYFRNANSFMIQFNSKFYLIFEIILLFFGAPLGLYLIIHFGNNFYQIKEYIVPLALSLICLILLIILKLDQKFHFRRLSKRSHFQFYLKEILWFFLPSVIITALFTYFMFPEAYFAFPKENFRMWIFIMIMYPLFSVLPQGILFRVFFFHRYKAIFKSKWAIIIASSVCFMFAHIIFNNFYALILTLIGGFFFAYRYHRTNSWLISSLEHAMYGNWMFTIGLGKFLVAGLAV